MPNCAHRAGIKFGHTPVCGVVLINLLTNGLDGSGTNFALISCTTAATGDVYNPASKPPANESAVIVPGEKNNFILN
ncbi:hypothetical protein D9M68_995220 [compost metagenome]